jgi:hypothetical protein
MKTITLNIGLNTNDGGKVPLHLAFVALSNRFEVIDSRVDTSGAEETLVAVVEFDENSTLTVDKIHELCNLLQQDCIACVINGENGELIGPNAAKWGKFDASQFVEFDADKPLVSPSLEAFQFIGWLESTLIPDLYLDQREATAEDFETLISHYRELARKCNQI